MNDFDNTGGSPAPDFDAMAPEALDAYIASGGNDLPETPVAEEAPAEIPAETPAAEPEALATPETPAAEEPIVIDDTPAEVPAAEEPAVELTEAQQLEKLEGFKFTENATPEIRAKEEAEYLELVDIAEPVQEMITARDLRIAELEKTVQPITDPAQKLHTDAFDALVTFVEDPESGSYIPNTEPVRQLFKEYYPNEREQFIRDTLREPSTKYAGYTVYQETLRDIGGLSDPQMELIGNFIENGGKFEFPPFVPEGIDPKVGQAYWTNPDREEIDTRIERARFALKDELSTPEEKASAETEIEKLNRHLVIVQKGIDADSRESELQRTSSDTMTQQITQGGATAYIKTTLGLTEQIKGDLVKTFSMFDTDAAEVTAAAYGVLITSALGDVDEYAKSAQRELTAKGIKVDWNQAAGALQKLYDSEKKIVALQTLKSNPRAVEIEQRNKAAILLELKGMQKNLVGQIAAKVTTGAGAALKTKLAAAPRAAKPSAVKPRIPGNSAGAIGDKKLDDMSLEELNSHVGRLKAEAGIRN